ncbi:DegT/DnrJ/EryC1/StrS family aminotransferase [Haloarcula marina]|uniref:DegT/DnrJ/EryC1/StrS family aminotransferase n=1 Tax=Haloarcula marina TaxID=2961574 RepID=UPI0020B79152|nr:DegT/DnrJ/EryC1/StrS family aminotransferase [Halomicroarcula marina]
MSDARSFEPTMSIASPDVGRDELRRIHDVLRSGHLSGGDEVDAFGAEFAEYCDVAHGVPTSNGTTALHAALVALGVGPGDTVLTTPFSFVATANAVRHAGADPVFADIDPQTYNLDPDSVAETMADRDVDAILAVHLYGCPAPMQELRALADEHDAALIEDAAQAHGATYRGDPVGSLGDAACFSFYPTKNMTTGEGGIVVTDDETVAENCWEFIDHGRDGEGNHASVGHNFRMTDICAAVGRVQLEKLNDYVEARRNNAAEYTEALVGSDLVAPVEPAGSRHSYHQYTIRCADREAVQDHLERYGVPSAVYYPRPIHEEPAYEDVTTSLPAAERAADEVLSVPVHPDLSARDVRAVSLALMEYDQ